MTKKSNNSRPHATKQDERVTKDIGTDIIPSNSIELSTIEFEGENIRFVEHNGKRLYPVHIVGEQYGYTAHGALQAFEANKKFLEGNYYRLKLRLYERAVSIPCLTGEGVLIYTARLGIGKIPEDRQVKVIRTVQFMAKAALGVIEGQLKPVTSPALLANIVQDRITTCKQVSAAVGCDLSTLLSIELAQVEEDTGQPIACRNLLPLQNQIRKAAVFTETQLGKQFNVTGRKIQIILKDKGYLQSIGGRVDFTYLGLLYGEWRPGIEFEGKPRTMVRMRRFWNQDIVPKLEEHFYYMQKAKEGLFLGELQAIS